VHHSNDTSMSYMVLKGEAPHTLLDDLESCFYVFFYISMTYTAPDCQNEELLTSYMSGLISLCLETQEGLLLEDSIPIVFVWLGVPLQNDLN